MSDVSHKYQSLCCDKRTKSHDSHFKNTNTLQSNISSVLKWQIPFIDWKHAFETTPRGWFIVDVRSLVGKKQYFTSIFHQSSASVHARGYRNQVKEDGWCVPPCRLPGIYFLENLQSSGAGAYRPLRQTRQMPYHFCSWYGTQGMTLVIACARCASTWSMWLRTQSSRWWNELIGRTQSVAVPDWGLGGAQAPKSWLAPKFSRPPKLWKGPKLAVLLTHCGQLILRKIVNSMPPDVRF